jgi:hypothetical protein
MGHKGRRVDASNVAKETTMHWIHADVFCDRRRDEFSTDIKSVQFIALYIYSASRFRLIRLPLIRNVLTYLAEQCG